MEGDNSEFPILHIPKKNNESTPDTAHAYLCCNDQMCNDRLHVAATLRNAQEILLVALNNSMMQQQEYRVPRQSDQMPTKSTDDTIITPLDSLLEAVKLNDDFYSLHSKDALVAAFVNSRMPLEENYKTNEPNIISTDLITGTVTTLSPPLPVAAELKSAYDRDGSHAKDAIVAAFIKPIMPSQQQNKESANQANNNVTNMAGVTPLENSGESGSLAVVYVTPTENSSTTSGLVMEMTTLADKIVTESIGTDETTLNTEPSVKTTLATQTTINNANFAFENVFSLFYPSESAPTVGSLSSDVNTEIEEIRNSGEVLGEFSNGNMKAGQLPHLIFKRHDIFMGK